MMLLKKLTLVAFVAAALADNAPVIKDNVQGAAYIAPVTSGSGPIIGSVQVIALPGQGAQVSVTLNDFNLADSLEYTYHIHVNKVPATNDCSEAATGLHFAQPDVADSFVCPAATPEQCQIGDLSGKHGAIILANGMTAVNLQYIDPFLSTTPGNPSFIGDRSIVVHRKSDKARLNCGNFKALGT